MAHLSNPVTQESRGRRIMISSRVAWDTVNLSPNNKILSKKKSTSIFLSFCTRVHDIQDVCRSEHNLNKSVLSFHHVGQTPPTIRRGSKHLHSLPYTGALLVKQILCRWAVSLDLKVLLIHFSQFYFYFMCFSEHSATSILANICRILMGFLKCMCGLPAHMHASGGWKTSDLVELELQVVVRVCVGTENQTQVLWNSIQCS